MFEIFARILLWGGSVLFKRIVVSWRTDYVSELQIYGQGKPLFRIICERGIFSPRACGLFTLHNRPICSVPILYRILLVVSSFCRRLPTQLQQLLGGRGSCR